jgi:multimeric flavodoxin WrbA
MAIVGIISSPHKNGSTAYAVNAILDAAKADGKDVQVFYINPMANRKGCQGCNACKKNGGSCITKDDLTPVLEAVRDADAVVVSSPVYFGEACGQYRLFEDRLYGFLNADFSCSLAPGKKAVAVTAAGSAGADELADKMLKPLVNYLKFEAVGKVAMVTANDMKYAENSADVKAQCAAIAKKL